MFANQQVFGDFKENVKTLAPGKASIHSSHKGLKSRAFNSFNDSTNVIKNKKSISKVNVDRCNFSLYEEKENSKPKIKVPDIKTEPHAEEDAWSDIEEMHIHVEPDDDFEDILPKCERIQKADIDSLFLNYSSTEFNGLTVDRLSSPIPEFKSLVIPEFSPLFPEIKDSLFDDTDLDFIALPNDFPVLE